MTWELLSVNNWCYSTDTSWVCVCIWTIVKSVKIKFIQRKGTRNITYNGYCDAGGEYCQLWHVHFGSEDDRCDSGHLFVMWSIKDNKKNHKKHNVGIRTCFGVGVGAEWKAAWIEEKINQGGCSDWQHAVVFSVKVSRTALILFLLPAPSLIHHLPPLPIMVLSSPPKRLAELPQYLLQSSLHCPPPSHSFLSGRVVAAHWSRSFNLPAP